MVDEEAIGSADRPGCGAKILRGDGALDQYLTRTNVMNLRVGCCQARNNKTKHFLSYTTVHLWFYREISLLSVWYYIISL